MKRWLAVTAAMVVVASGAASATPPEPDVRFATFNASLNRSEAGQLRAHLSAPAVDDVFRRQIRNVAEVVQVVRPDVLLINEFDFDPLAVDLFRDNFLEVPQNGAAPIEYPYAFIAPSNTGIPTGKDLDNNGSISGPNDAFGFGAFPGQFGMVVYSRHPIAFDDVRTFQLFRWKDMPGNLIPTPFYSPDEVDILRLSSKSHWDVPIEVGRKTVHFLVSHPTPPVFDGSEDRNGRRNHDEIRFWADYITPGKSSYIYDDEGVHGGLQPGELFVIAGDQNADPLDGDSVPGAIQQLLEHPLVNTKLTPHSPGAIEASALQGGANATHRGDPRFDTADFADSAPGNLRVDYVLPRKTLQLVSAGVFWPLRADPLSRLTGVFDAAQWGPVGGFPTSDHRSVWIDVTVPGAR
jgi:Endonuclease/Exonuclease/phosphatase family